MDVQKEQEKKRQHKEDKTLAAAQQQIKDLTDTLQRLQAEFENYKKRTEKETVQQRQYAAKELIAALLPVLDSFELAFQNTKEKENFIEGMKLVYGQFYSILENAGLRKIEAVGRCFDPYYHEVLLQEPSEEDDGKILEEFQKGYMLKDSVIRHSKVKVAKKMAERQQKGQKGAEATQ